MKKTMQLALSAFIATSALLPSIANAYTWNCKVVEVFEAEEFISVACDNLWDDIRYHAIDKRDHPWYVANRFVTMATAALLSGKRLRVRGDSGENQPAGCTTSNCREIHSFGIEAN